MSASAEWAAKEMQECQECGESEFADPCTDDVMSPCYGCIAGERFKADMLRYLFRNVSCEYRKSLKDFHHMPDLPGWM